MQFRIGMHGSKTLNCLEKQSVNIFFFSPKVLEKLSSQLYSLLLKKVNDQQEMEYVD